MSRREKRFRLRIGKAAGLGLDVCGDVPDGRIVALRAGDDGFGHGDHVTVARLEAGLFPGGLNGSGSDGGNVVTLANDGGTHAPNDCTDGSHGLRSFFFNVGSGPAIAGGTLENTFLL